MILLLMVIVTACNVAKPSLARKIQASKFSIEIKYFEMESYETRPDGFDYLSSGKYVISIDDNTKAKSFTFSAPRHHFGFINLTHPKENVFFIEAPNTLIVSANFGQTWQIIPFEELNKKFRPNCSFNEYSVKATRIFVNYDCENDLALQIYSEDFGQLWRMR